MISQMRKNRSVAHILFLVYLTMFLPLQAYGLPQGGTVVSGQAGISRPSALDMKIQQATQKAIINWNSFSIGASESVNIVQPGASSISLNRVVGIDPSLLDGLLSSNGRVFLINPNGILVGPTGRINVNSFIGSSLDIADQDFLNDEFVFTVTQGAPLSQILNQGNIAAAEGGFVSLMGPSVQNAGTIAAKMGKVYLAGAEKVTLNFAGNDLVGFVLDESVKDKIVGFDGQEVDSTVSNTGKVSAAGGEVILSASTAKDLVQSVVNNEGVVEAVSMESKNGVIRLLGGDEGIVSNSGLLDASGTESGETGGTVHVLGEKIGLFDQGRIDVSGEAGGGEVLFGGEYRGEDPDVPNSRMAYLGPDSKVSADALGSGDGGRIIVWSDEGSQVYGALSAKGGSISGDGGFVETSSKIGLDVRISPDVSAVNGAGGLWLIDPYDITIVSGDTITPTVEEDEINNAFTSIGSPAQLGVEVIADALKGGNSVTIQTGNSGGDEPGNLTWNASLTYSNPKDSTLTLIGHNNVIINQNIIADKGKLALELQSDSDNAKQTDLDDIDGGKVSINANIYTNGGAFSADSNGGVIELSSGKTINTNGGSFSADSDGGNIDLDGIVNTYGGSFTVYSDAGTIDLSGEVNTTGGAAGGEVSLNSGGGSIGSTATISTSSGGFTANSSGGTISLGGTINTTNNGKVTLNAGSGSIDSTATITTSSSGFTANSSGGTISLGGTLNTDNGKITLNSGGGTINVGGTVNTSGGIFEANAFSGSNYGTITVDGQVNTSSGAFTAVGTNFNGSGSVVNGDVISIKTHGTSDAINFTGSLGGATLSVAAYGNCNVFLEGNNDVDLIELLTADDATISEAKIKDVTDIKIGDLGSIANLTVNASGLLSQKEGSTLTVSGTATLNTSGVFHLENANIGGALNVTANTVDGSQESTINVGEKATFNIGSGLELGTLTVGKHGSNGGELEINAPTSISQTAGKTLTVGGTATLNTSGCLHLEKAVIGGDLKIGTNASAIPTSISISGTAGNDLTVNGNATLKTSGNFHLENGDIQLSLNVDALTLEKDLDSTINVGEKATFTIGSGLELGTLTVGKYGGNGGELEINAPTSISQTAGEILTVDGTATLNTSGSLQLEKAVIGGDLYIGTNPGATPTSISISGTAGNDLTVNGNATLKTSGNIYLENAGIGENAGTGGFLNVEAATLENILVSTIQVTNQATFNLTPPSTVELGNLSVQKWNGSGGNFKLSNAGNISQADGTRLSVEGNAIFDFGDGVRYDLNLVNDGNTLHRAEVINAKEVNITTGAGASGGTTYAIDATGKVVVVQQGGDLIVDNVVSTFEDDMEYAVSLTTVAGSIKMDENGSCVKGPDLILNASGDIGTYDDAHDPENGALITDTDEVQIISAENVKVKDIGEGATAFRIDSAGGDVVLKESNGDFQISNGISIQGGVWLFSAKETGEASILGKQVADGAADIQASSVHLSAKTDIGEEGKELLTNTGSVDAYSGSNTYLADVGDTDTTWDAESFSGDIHITQTARNLVAGSIVSNSASGLVELEASLGAIKEKAGTTGYHVEASKVSLWSNQDIGTGANRIETSAAKVEVGNAANVYLDEQSSEASVFSIGIDQTVPGNAVTGNVDIMKSTGDLKIEGVHTDTANATVTLTSSTGSVVGLENGSSPHVKASVVEIWAEESVYMETGGGSGDPGNFTTQVSTARVNNAEDVLLEDSSTDPTVFKVGGVEGASISGNVTIVKNNTDMLIEIIKANQADKTVDLRSQGAIAASDDSTDVHVAAESVILAADGAIRGKAEGKELKVEASSVTVEKAAGVNLLDKSSGGSPDTVYDIGQLDSGNQVSGTVKVVKEKGNILLEKIATDGDVVLVAQDEDGQILEHEAAAGIDGLDIACQTANLTASTGIGQAGEGNELDTRIGKLVAKVTGTGSIFVLEADALDLGGASIDETVETQKGDINVHATGDLNIYGLTTARDEGEIHLESEGNIVVGADGKVETFGDAGITIHAEDKLTLKDDASGKHGLVINDSGTIDIQFDQLTIQQNSTAAGQYQIISQNGEVVISTNAAGPISLFGSGGSDLVDKASTAQIKTPELRFDLPGYTVDLNPPEDGFSENVVEFGLTAGQVNFVGDKYEFGSLDIDADNGIYFNRAGNIAVWTVSGPLYLNKDGVGDITLNVANSVVDLRANQKDGFGMGEIHLGNVLAAGQSNPKLSLISQGDVTLESVDINEGVLLVNLDTNGKQIDAVLSAGPLIAGYIFIGKDDDDDDDDEWAEIVFEGNVKAEKGDNSAVWADKGILVEHAKTVRLSDNLNLTAETGDITFADSVGTLLLTGSHSFITQIGSVNLTDVTEADASSSSLAIDSAKNIDLSSVDIGGDLTIDFANGGSLNTGSLEAKSVAVDGSGGSSRMNFEGNVKAVDGNLDISNAGEVVLADGVELSAAKGDTSGATDVNIHDGITQITMGAGANGNKISANDGSIRLGATSGSNTGKLALEAKDAIDLDAVIIDGGLEITRASSVTFNKNVTAEGSITVKNSADNETVAVNLAGDVFLKSMEGDVTMSADNGNGVSGIHLIGAEGTENGIEAVVGNLSLASIDDGGSPDRLTIAGKTVDIESVNISGDLVISAGKGMAGDALHAGDLRAGSIDVSGTDGNDSLYFEGVLESKTDDISIRTAQLADFSDDVNASTSLTVADTETVNIGRDLYMTAQGGNLDIASDKGRITFDRGIGEIHLAAGGTYDVDLGEIYQTGEQGTLFVNAGGGVSAAQITLPDADLDIEFNNGRDPQGKVFASTGITANDITLKGGGNAGDRIDFDGDISAGGILTVEKVGVADIASGIGLSAQTAVKICKDMGAILITGSSDQATSIAAPSGYVALGKITDTDGGTSDTLNISAKTAVNIASAQMARLLDITAGESLTVAGDLTAGGIHATGISGGETFTFQGPVSSTLRSILIDNAGKVLFSGDVTAKTDLTVRDIGESVSLGDGVDLKASNGNVDLTDNVSTVDLAGSSATAHRIAAEGDGDVKLANVTDSGVANDLSIEAQGSVESNSLVVLGDLEIVADTDHDGQETVTLDEASARNLTISGGTDLDDQIDVTRGLTSEYDLVAAEDLIFKNAANVDLEGNVKIKASQNLSAVDNVGRIFLRGDSGTTNMIEAVEGSVDIAAKITDHSSPDKLTVKAGKFVNLSEVDISGILEIIGPEGVKIDGDINSGAGFYSSGGTFELENGSISTADSPIFIDHVGDVSIAGELDPGAGQITINGDKISISKSIISESGFFSEGTTFVFTGEKISTLGAPISINYTGDVTILGALDSGSGATNVTGDNIKIGADVTAGGGFDTQGTTFEFTGDKISTSGSPLSIAFTGDVDISGELDSGAGTTRVDGKNVKIQADVHAGGGFASSGAGTFENKGGKIVTDNSNIAIKYDGLVTIASALSSGAGDIHVDSNERIDIRETGGIQTTTGSVFLGKNSEGGIGLAANISTEGGDILFYSNTNLTENILLDTGSGSGDVFFGGDLTGKGELAITSGAGTARFEGTVDLGGLSITANQIDLPTITTTGMQEYKGNISLRGDLNSGSGVRLDGPVTLLASVTVSGNAIDFEESVTGGQVLTLMGSSIAIQGTASVATLVANGTTSVLVHDVDTTGDQIYSGRTTVAGNLDSGNAIIFNSSVTLASNEIEMEAQSDIIFHKTLDGKSSGGQVLRIQSSGGELTFMEAVGSKNKLGGLYVEEAQGGVFFLSTVVSEILEIRNTSNLVFSDDIIAENGFSVEIGDFENQAEAEIQTLTGPLTIKSTGNVSILSVLRSGDGEITISSEGANGVVLIDSAIESDTGDVNIFSAGQTIVTENGDIFTGTGDVVFGGEGSGEIFTGGDATTAGGSISFLAESYLTGPVVFSTGEEGGDIRFEGGLNAANGEAIDLSLFAGSGVVSFQGPVGDQHALASLKIEGAGGVTADGSVSAGRVDFVNAGDVELKGDLTASDGFSSQGDAFLNTGKIETADADIIIQHQGPVAIQGDISAGAGAVDIDAIGPDATLSILAGIHTTTGLVTIDSMGGSVLGETGLVRTETGDILFGQDLPGALALYGNVETNGGDILFASPVLVGGEVRVDTGEGPGDVTFQSVLDAVAPNRNDTAQRTLDILAGTGNVVFAGRTGGSNPLDVLTVGPASSVTVQDALDAALVQFLEVETVVLNGDVAAANGFSSKGGTFDGERASITTQGADIAVEHTQNASFGGNLNSNGGKISLSAGGEMSLADGASLDSSGGEIALAAGKNLTAGSSAGISTGGGQLSVETGEALDLGENFSVATQGGSATLASGADFTVGAGAAVETGGGGLSLVSSADLIAGEAASFRSFGGGLALESGLDLNAGQGVSLDSGGGSLGVAAGQDLNIGAHSSLDSGNGSLTVRSGRNATFQTGVALASSGGDASIEAADGLTLGDQISFDSGTGRLSLTAGGDLAAGDQLSLTTKGDDLLVKAEGAMDIGERAALDSDGGELLLQSGGSSSIGNSAVLDSGAGQLKILSGESLTAGSNFVANAKDGDVLLRSDSAMSIGNGSAVNSGTGDLEIRSGQNLAAGSDVSVTSEDGTVLLSSNGAMDIGDGSTVDSGKGELKIQSGESLTAGSNISVKSVNGPVLLSSNGAMDIGDGATVDSGTGELQIQSNESLTAGSNISVKSENGPVLLSSNGAMKIGDGATVDSGTGELKIQSGESLTAGSNIAVKSKNGPVFLSSEGAMDIGSGSTVDSGTGELKILSGEGMTAGANVSVKSESGPVLLSSNGDMDIGDASTVDSGTGELKVLSGGSMTAGADVSLKSKSGPVLLSSDGAMDIGDRSVVDSGTGELQIRSGENLTAGSEVALNTDDNDMLLHSEGAMNIGNGTSVETNGGNAEIYAGGPMALDGQIRSGNGDIVVSGNDTVAMAPDSVIDAGSGKIAMNSGGAMTVTALQTTYKSSSDQDPAVTLSSRGGIFDADNDGQNAAKDIDAAKGLLEVRSPLGIGTESNPLEISVSSLTVLSDIADGPLADMPNAAWTGDGVHGVYLDTAGGLFINDLKTIDGGNVFMTANGALSVVELAAEDGDVQLAASAIHGKTQDDGIDIEAKNIELHATEGAIKVGSIKAASTGKVTLIAELGIESGEGQTGYIRGGEGVFKSLNFGTNNSPLLIDLNSILFEANENVDQSTRVGLFSAAPGGAPAKGQIKPVIPLNTYGVVMGYYGSIDTGKIFFFFIGGRDIEAYLLGLSSSTVQEEKLEEMLAALVASDTWEPPPPQDIPEIALEAQPAPSLTERDETFPTLLWYDRNETATVPGLSRRNPDWPRLDKSGLQAFFNYDPGLRGLL